MLTTPESLSLLLSYPESAELLSNLKRVVVDEVHAFATGKRGDLLALALALVLALAAALWLPPLRRQDIEALMLADRAPAGYAAPNSPAAAGGFYLQLGAYSRAENAEA